MLIDRINILTAYNSIMTKRDIQTSKVVNYNDWLENADNPIKLKEERFKFSEITVKLLVEGSSENDVLTKISNIITKCKSGVLKFDDIEYSFNVTLIDSLNRIIRSEYYELTLIFQSDCKYKPQVIEVANKVTTKAITVTGNMSTPCTIEITPISDIIDIKLEGLADDPITIRNLKANKKVIIDGELGKVTVDGVNKFGDTDMWDFPRLVPGTNSIKISRNSCDINIKYKPRFI